MTKPLTLEGYTDTADEIEEGAVSLRVSGKSPPAALANLRRLRRLDLLTDEAIWSLVGQAPIDPLGVFGALKDFGVWAFQAIDFTVVQVLAKHGAKPVALMRLDLLSDDITFVALKDGKLETHDTLTGEQIVEKLKEPQMTQDKVLAWLSERIQAAIAAGSR